MALTTLRAFHKFLVQSCLCLNKKLSLCLRDTHDADARWNIKLGDLGVHRLVKKDLVSVKSRKHGMSDPLLCPATGQMVVGSFHYHAQFHAATFTTERGGSSFARFWRQEFWWFPPVGGPLLPKQAGGTPQIPVIKTLRMTSRPALYFSPVWLADVITHHSSLGQNSFIPIGFIQ